jgi:hypothetical protein
MVMKHDGWAVLCSVIKKTWNVNQIIISHKLNKRIAGTQANISFHPAYTSILSCCHVKHPVSILNDLDNMWLVETNTSCSKTHPITYTNCSVCSGLPSATFNRILMLTPRMLIDFHLAEMAPKGSCKGMGNTTARAQMLTLAINRRLSLHRGCIMRFILGQICGFIQIYDACEVMDEMAWIHF